jgi:hypothetical protein
MRTLLLATILCVFSKYDIGPENGFITFLLMVGTSMCVIQDILEIYFRNREKI